MNTLDLIVAQKKEEVKDFNRFQLDSFYLSLQQEANLACEAAAEIEDDEQYLAAFRKVEDLVYIAVKLGMNYKDLPAV